jgi:hypothetical protein
MSKEIDDRGDEEEDEHSIPGRRKEVLALRQKTPSTGREVPAAVKEPLLIEEAL